MAIDFEKDQRTGAPLRNRTVDLLLTICNSLGSPPGQRFLQADGKRWPGSSRGLRHLRSLSPSRRLRRSSWLGPCPVSGSAPTPGCRSGPARGAACRPATSAPTVKTRSDDLCYPARPGPEGHEQAFPIARKNLNHCPCLHVASKSPRQPRGLAEPKITPRHMQDTESGDLVARARPAAPARPTLAGERVQVRGRGVLRSTMPEGPVVDRVRGWSVRVRAPVVAHR
jgi:hypothetical protein